MTIDRTSHIDKRVIATTIKAFEVYCEDKSEYGYEPLAQNILARLTTASTSKQSTQEQVTNVLKGLEYILTKLVKSLDGNPEKDSSLLKSIFQNEPIQPRLIPEASASEHMQSGFYGMAKSQLNKIRRRFGSTNGMRNYPPYHYIPAPPEEDADEKVIANPRAAMHLIITAYTEYVQSKPDAEARADYHEHAKATLQALKEVIIAGGDYAGAIGMRAIVENQLRVLDGSHGPGVFIPNCLSRPYSTIAPRIPSFSGKSASEIHKESAYYKMNEQIFNRTSDGDAYNGLVAKQRTFNEDDTRNSSYIAENICRLLRDYNKPISLGCCSISKFSLFGHHHNGRAIDIEKAIQENSGDFKKIRTILKNQRDLLMGWKKDKVTPAPKALHVNARWTSPDQIINNRTDHQNSGYFKAIDQAIQHYDDHCPSHLRVNEPDEEPGKAKKIVQQISENFGW